MEWISVEEPPPEYLDVVVCGYLWSGLDKRYHKSMSIGHCFSGGEKWICQLDGLQVCFWKYEQPPKDMT